MRHVQSAYATTKRPPASFDRRAKDGIQFIRNSRALGRSGSPLPSVGHMPRAKLIGGLKAGVALFGILMAAGLSIGSTVPMPDYAVVFLDDSSKAYIALPCIEEWRTRPSRTVSLARRGTAGEARALKYQPDDRCRESSGFVGEGRSLTGMMLEKLGLLSPVRHWWDASYKN
jgi:hypothetical protein